MKKTLITAATIAMSAGLVGVAAASAGTSNAREQAPAVPTSQTPSSDDHGHGVEPGDDRGRGVEPGDDRGSGGHGADDVPAPATTSVLVARPGHDVGDDHGSGGHGGDD